VWHLDLVAHAKFAFDRDQAGQDSRAVFTFKATFGAQLGDLLAQRPDLCGNLARPAVRDASRSTGTGSSATPPGAVAGKLWNGFNTHLLP
jgi:hypothetical protein